MVARADAPSTSRGEKQASFKIRLPEGQTIKVDANTRICFAQDNQRLRGSKSLATYDRYKVARTTGEFMELHGGPWPCRSRADMQRDALNGQVTFPDFVPACASRKRETHRTTAKKRRAQRVFRCTNTDYGSSQLMKKCTSRSATPPSNASRLRPLRRCLKKVRWGNVPRSEPKRKASECAAEPCALGCAVEQHAKEQTAVEPRAAEQLPQSSMPATSSTDSRGEGAMPSETVFYDGSTTASVQQKPAAEQDEDKLKEAMVLRHCEEDSEESVQTVAVTQVLQATAVSEVDHTSVRATETECQRPAPKRRRVELCPHEADCPMMGNFLSQEDMQKQRKLLVQLQGKGIQVRVPVNTCPPQHEAARPIKCERLMSMVKRATFAYAGARGALGGVPAGGCSAEVTRFVVGRRPFAGFHTSSSGPYEPMCVRDHEVVVIAS